MFDQLYKAQRAPERHFKAPLLDERIRYLSHWAAQGSTRSSLRVKAQDLLTIIEYLDLEAAGDIDEEQINKAADRWARRQPQPPNVIDFRYGKLRFISHATQWLAFLGRLHQPEVPRPPYIHMIEEFSDYMREEKGLSPVTVHKRCQHVTQFLSRFDEQHRPFNEVSILDIDAAIARKGEHDAYTRSSIRTYASALRAFFHYAEQRGWCDPGLATAIMSPCIFAGEQLPKGPSWKDVQRLLASTEGDNATDIRDRALIMLFAVYGLRVSEVRALRLEDLDWENELLYVTRPKPRRRQTYPLSHTVGEALLRYLKEVRPSVRYREVFLTLLAPIQPSSSNSLYCTVAERFRALNIPSPHRGPHALRHACATRLLAEGLSMKEIGDHLGHRKPDSTRVYAKVDLAGLRQVADFEIGGVL
jgi:site-specific recombinase XerD